MGRTDPLPLFPLSTVVLFPRVQCPLHLFEPRYRQLAAHVLAGGQRIGMIAVRPESVAEIHGNPRLFEVGCAGHVTEHQKLPDGRYNIVLLGTQRFRIVRELDRPSGQLFRVAEVEILEDHLDAGDGGRIAALRPRVLELIRELARRKQGERARPFAAERFRGIDDATFVNALCNAFPFPPAEKQGLLEADSALHRLEHLAEVLRFHLAESSAPAAPAPGTLH